MLGVPSIDTNASTLNTVSETLVLKTIATLLPPTAVADAPLVLAI